VNQNLDHKQCRPPKFPIRSDEVVLHLVTTKCIRVLLYGLEVCPLIKAELQSLDFAVTRFLMKLFKTFIAVIKDCCRCFGFNCKLKYVSENLCPNVVLWPYTWLFYDILCTYSITVVFLLRVCFSINVFLYMHVLPTVVLERIWKWGEGGARILHFLALKVQLVVSVSAFVMVSTVWSVSCLLYSSTHGAPVPHGVGATVYQCAGE